MRISQNTSDYFEIGDRADLVYEEKLERYGQLADAYFQAEEFEEFRTTVLPHLDELMVEYVGDPEFDDLLVHSIRLEVEPGPRTARIRVGSAGEVTSRRVRSNSS
jgi:hypothetical protein